MIKSTSQTMIKTAVMVLKPAPLIHFNRPKSSICKYERMDRQYLPIDYDLVNTSCISTISARQPKKSKTRDAWQKIFNSRTVLPEDIALNDPNQVKLQQEVETQHENFGRNPATETMLENLSIDYQIFQEQKHQADVDKLKSEIKNQREKSDQIYGVGVK